MIPRDKQFSNLKVDGIFVSESSTIGSLRANRAVIGSLVQGVGDGASLQIIIHTPTDELVFKVTESDGTVKYARLPLNMGIPLFGDVSSFPDPCVRTLSVVTEPTGLAKLLAIRPIKGINYQPSPSDYTTLPPPSQYFDSDFYNSDFEGLWGDTLVPGGGTPCAVSAARNDLKRFHEDLDLNFVRFFNLNQEAQRDHIPFLSSCQQNQIFVMLPLDFWVQQVDGGTNWPDPFQGFVIDLIQTLGPSPAVVAWQLGNELNGSVNAGKIATIFDLLVKYDVNKKPVTSALQLGFFPSFASEIKDAIVAKGLETDYTNRYFQSVNIYPPQTSVVTDALVNLQLIVNTLWPTSEFKDQPFLVSEYGTAQNVSAADQAASISAQAKWIKNVDNKNFLGGCIFEFSNEVWKGGLQDDLGLVNFTGLPLTFCTSEEPSNSTIYRVDDLVEKALVYDAFKAVVNP